MPFKEGESGNPNGRPKGSVNKASASLRESINQFLADNFESVQRNFDELEPKDRIKLWIELLQYALPKLRTLSLADAEMEEAVFSDNGINPITGHRD